MSPEEIYGAGFRVPSLVRCHHLLLDDPPSPPAPAANSKRPKDRSRRTRHTPYKTRSRRSEPVLSRATRTTLASLRTKNIGFLAASIGSPMYTARPSRFGAVQMVHALAGTSCLEVRHGTDSVTVQDCAWCDAVHCHACFAELTSTLRATLRTENVHSTWCTDSTTTAISSVSTELRLHFTSTRYPDDK